MYSIFYRNYVALNFFFFFFLIIQIEKINKHRLAHMGTHLPYDHKLLINYMVMSYWHTVTALLLSIVVMHS